MIEEENFAENIAEEEKTNKRIFNSITPKTKTPKFDQNLILEEPAPMGYLKKEDLDERNLIEKDDSEDENLTEKENLEDHRNKEDAEIDTIEIKVEKRKDAEIDTIEIEADEIRLIEEENFAENIAYNETANKKIFC